MNFGKINDSDGKQARQFKDSPQSFYEKTGRRSDTNCSPQRGLIHFNSSLVLPPCLRMSSTISGCLRAASILARVAGFLSGRS